MKITGTFLDSKIGRRIAILLLIAAVTPVVLMTLLSTAKLQEIVVNYEHKLLREKTQNYALSIFSNLIFARENLKQTPSKSIENKEAINQTIIVAQRNITVFKSIVETTEQGEIIYSDGYTADQLPQAILQQLESIRPNTSYIAPVIDAENQSHIYMILHKATNAPITNFLVAELNQHYLWGEKEEYGSDANLCVSQLNGKAKLKLFCSIDGHVSSSTKSNSPSLNHADWELFLRGEFSSDPWLFELSRINPISQNHLREFVGSSAFITITILSILIVGFLSLIQIRKSMNPLEQLVRSTKRLIAGDFSPVKVEDDSEFSELAEAFNRMSDNIKRQINTLQSYAEIDKEIVSKIDIEYIIQLVLHRMQSIAPDALLLIAKLEEESSKETQCNCFISGDQTPDAIRLPIPNNEINFIKRLDQGRSTPCELTSQHAHERLMAELGAKYIWVLPIFWQGEIYAFFAAGSKNEPNPYPDSRSEFRELASRVGIVISAHEREQQLLIEAQYDSLTGLPNRVLLLDRLNLAMEHSDHTGQPMWVVFLDLDRFKDINDSMGHPVGDELLKTIAERLSLAVRDTDTVARFGGDEFVIVLSGDAGENIQLSVLNRLMDVIAEPIHVHNQDIISTCSIGISVYPSDGKNAEVLIKNADIAMYRAKEIGRNNFQFFTQELNNKAAERMQIISMLRKALNDNEFNLHYQPKIDLSTQEIVGVEALIRWHNESLGDVPPYKFIPIAEEAGLINAIGDWVMETACRQMAIWQKTFKRNITISVNISAQQFHQSNLTEKIKSVLVNTDLRAELLELELTESLLMTKAENTLSTLHAIKSMGIRLSIDDFGTGFSNLSYLNTLPIDTLKIDKAFVDAIILNDEKSPIVDTIINLAKNLSLEVVAEGVETLNQVKYLKDRDCDQMQGYYFSRPVDEKAFTQLLLSGKKLEIPANDAASIHPIRKK